MAKAAKRERQKENRERAREERERMLKRQRRNRTLRSLAFVLVPIVVIMVIISLVSSNDDEKSASSSSSTSKACGTPVKNPTRKFDAPPPQTIDQSADYRATMCTSEGDITFFLDAKSAPVATNNFVFLASQGFYDGLDFHRAVKDFMVQGGDPAGDGSGGPGYTVQGEVPTNNYPVGSLAAAKTSTDPPGTMGSQFFIVTGSQGATLPNEYALFGRVNKGADVAQKIESYATQAETLTKKVTINAIRITENGKVLGPTGSTTSTTAGK